jgi:condensin-2 complex subunit G2
LLQLFSSGNDRQKLREGISVRDQKQLLFKTIRTLPKATARRFFAGLYGHVNAIIQRESYLPDSAYPDDDDYDREDEGSLIEVTPDPASSVALQFLCCSALCVQAYVDETIASKRHNDDPSARKVPIHIKIPVIAEVYQIARAMHDVLLTLNSAGPNGLPTQAAISLVCETWWTNNLENRDSLVLQVLPLIVHSIINEDTRSGLKRLYQLREAIQAVDIDCPDSHAFKTGVLHLASSPKVLKLPEGKKLLSYLLQLDHAILRGLHKAIRVQIPGLRGPLLTAFGECYFRAWKDAPSQESREAIESVALQDLVHTAVHTAKPNLLKSLLSVLEPFHSERKNPEVEKLLFRMYSGMIWRSLSTANGKIRVNATHVFAQVFPLRDASAAQTENALRRATDALETLLQDPDPNVRVAASQAVAQIMPTYWDVLPPQEIREILNRTLSLPYLPPFLLKIKDLHSSDLLVIVLEHASDRSSSSVRCAAVDAISCVLDAPQSHGVLRPLLPLMGNLIHDRVEKVRMSVVRLLLKVKSTRGIKYFHVVPVEHLIGRLEEEATMNSRGPIPQGLTGLMVNSFCPHGTQAQSRDQVNRAIKLVTENPVAAMVFYTNLPRHVPFRTVKTLVSNLFQCLHAVIRGMNREGACETNEGSASAADRPLKKAMNIVAMTNLIETISAMMQAMPLSVSDSSKSIDQPQPLDMPTLLDLLEFFESYQDGGADTVEIRNVQGRGITALLSCARNQPPDSLRDLIEHSKKVLSLCSDRGSLNVAPYVSLLCSVESTDDVASALASSIASSFDREFTLSFASPEAGSRKRKTGKSGKKNETLPMPILPPKVALAALGSILKGHDSVGTAARESFFALASAVGVLEGALVRGTKHAEHLFRGKSRVSHHAVESICGMFWNF